MLEALVAIGAITCFFIFAILVVRYLFNAEFDDIKTKDKRYYYKKYLYHKKEAKRAYKKYQSLNWDGGDSIKSRRRNYE